MPTTTELYKGVPRMTPAPAGTGGAHLNAMSVAIGDLVETATTNAAAAVSTANTANTTAGTANTNASAAVATADTALALAFPSQSAVGNKAVWEGVAGYMDLSINMETVPSPQGILRRHTSAEIGVTGHTLHVSSPTWANITSGFTNSSTSAGTFKFGQAVIHGEMDAVTQVSINASNAAALRGAYKIDCRGLKNVDTFSFNTTSATYEAYMYSCDLRDMPVLANISITLSGLSSKRDVFGTDIPILVDAAHPTVYSVSFSHTYNPSAGDSVQYLYAFLLNFPALLNANLTKVRFSSAGLEAFMMYMDANKAGKVGGGRNISIDVRVDSTYVPTANTTTAKSNLITAGWTVSISVNGVSY